MKKRTEIVIFFNKEFDQEDCEAIGDALNELIGLPPTHQWEFGSLQSVSDLVQDVTLFEKLKRGMKVLKWTITGIKKEEMFWRKNGWFNEAAIQEITRKDKKSKPKPHLS